MIYKGFIGKSRMLAGRDYSKTLANFKTKNTMKSTIHVPIMVLSAKTIKQFAFQRKVDPVDLLGLSEKLIFAKDAAGLAYEKYKKEIAGYENEFQRAVMVHMMDEYPRVIINGYFLTRCNYYENLAKNLGKGKKAILKFPNLSINEYKKKISKEITNGD